MTVLYEVNSRFKDFYDVYHSAQTESFEFLVLREAISRTFERRFTSLAGILCLFDTGFKKNAERQRQWRGFLDRVQPDEALSFEDVMDLLELFFEPIVSGQAIGVWRPAEGSWSR